MKSFILCLTAAVLLSACSAKSVENEPTTQEAPKKIYTPGTYEGKSTGHGGIVKVTITVSENEITDLVVTAKDETPGIGSLAVEALPNLILKAQSAEVDTYTGATETSEGIIAATKDALSQAASGR